MSSFHAPALAGLALVSLAACGGGGGGGAVIVPPNAVSIENAQPAQTARADISRHRDGRIMLDITDGPMQGMTVLCQDQTMGSCTVVGGAPGTDPEGRLTARMAGDYAFLGNFEVQRRDGATATRTNQIVYAALPEQRDVTPNLPDRVVDYTGQFQGGYGLSNDDSGQITGTTRLLANFGTGRMSGEMAATTAAGTALSASFNNLEIDATTRTFVSNNDTTIRFQNQQAWGDMTGGFYGPNADEAAGVFNFGNGAGGMSGMFLACDGATADCVSP